MLGLVALVVLALGLLLVTPTVTSASTPGPRGAKRREP